MAGFLHHCNEAEKLPTFEELLRHGVI